MKYRSLCEREGHLYVIESDGETTYASFINALKELGVYNSIFLVKEGRDYSWYRKNIGSIATYINTDDRNLTNNWIIFYGKYT